MNRFFFRRKKLTSFQLISTGFAGVIIIGTLLLMLPVSSKAGVFTPFSDALFTATSAVCVTGLVVRDTASYWSLFGQGIILLLIQIGGLGVITVAASFSLILGRKISLKQRSTIQEAISAPTVGGIVRLTRFILFYTFLIELTGSLVMMPRFIRDHGLRGVWMSFFHSISAFCNAGFDLMGTVEKPFDSLVSYAASPLITITIMTLIIVGGLSFMTWVDIHKHRHHLKRYSMQSKVILVMTFCLIVLPTLFFYFHDFKGMPLDKRVLCSLFQAVTPRTAGFNTADLTKMTGPSRVLIIILMLIGGAPGSTAGGMKVTTVAVLLANVLSVFFQDEDIHLFHRRIDPHTICNAATILVMYIFLSVGGALVISVVENLPAGVCLFETASAAGTVGLTLGITPGLGQVSRVILVILMFMGRVGGLTLVYSAVSGTGKKLSRLPIEKITVG